MNSVTPFSNAKVSPYPGSYGDSRPRLSGPAQPGELPCSMEHAIRDFRRPRAHAGKDGIGEREAMTPPIHASDL